MTYFVKNHYHSTVWVPDLEEASASLLGCSVARASFWRVFRCW